MGSFCPVIPRAPENFWTLCKSKYTFNITQLKIDQSPQFLGLK